MSMSNIDKSIENQCAKHRPILCPLNIRCFDNLDEINRTITEDHRKIKERNRKIDRKSHLAGVVDGADIMVDIELLSVSVGDHLQALDVV